MVRNDTHGEPVDAAIGNLAEFGEPSPELQAALNAFPHMVWSTRPDGFHDFYNQRWYDATGVPRGSTDGEAWNGMFHRDDQARAWEVWRHSLATGDPYKIEYRLRHADGEYRWVLGRAMPVRDEDGRITRWIGTCTDIDDLKRAESALELLAGELSHRIGNIFAVMLALLSATARHRPEAAGFAQEFGDKVHALAHAHSLVRSGAAIPADNLHDLLGALAAPYQLGKVPAIAISGDDTVLGIKAAGALALMVHELATNALKHGALSRPLGRVDLRARVDEGQLVIEWHEEGGPPVTGKPTSTGFGTDMKRRAAVQLRGEVVEEWDADGLRVQLRFPLDALTG